MFLYFASELRLHVLLIHLIYQMTNDLNLIYNELKPETIVNNKSALYFIDYGGLSHLLPRTMLSWKSLTDSFTRGTQIDDSK